MKTLILILILIFILKQIKDQNLCKTQVALTILTKHIVRLRCRCSCEMCSTSAVPLLVISETSVKPS